MKKIRNLLCALALSSAALVSAQNVYDTYNPYMDSITGTYSGSQSNQGYEGEYQLFDDLLGAWYNINANTVYTISYKIEPVSFPFTADCTTGDCGDSTRTTRNMILIAGYVAEDYIFRKPFIDAVDTLQDPMSEPTILLSKVFTTVTPIGSGRDYLPHTVLKHTYYLHQGPTMDDPIIDSFSFVLDHTRGFMSEYPFRPNNWESATTQHDITIHPWFVYFNNDSFLTIPEQTTNFLNTLNYFPYPDPGHFSDTNSYWNQIPDTANVDRYEAPHFYSHPSPYSLVGIMLGNAHEGPFAGTEENNDALHHGVAHTYLIDQSLDLTKINPSERVIYNPSAVYITSPTPVVFPSGYTFMTVGGLYPTAVQVAALDPNGMHGSDQRKIPITGSALNLTDNPRTDAIDSLSFYYVTSGCTLRIEPCVTIYDATIVVDSGGVIQLDTNSTYGNFVLQLNTGSTLVQMGSSPAVACKYLCYEESNYNERHVTITTHKSWDTTNIESNFPGTATWAAATNNTAKFVEGITIDSGASLTVRAGVNLEFGPLGKVIVKKGGKLIVEGSGAAYARFGPACQMEWLGIEVWGDSSLTQSAADTTHQGAVKMEYTIVEHARTALLAGDPTTPGKEGGVIRAYYCLFYDNVRDAVFLPYRNRIQDSSTVTLGNVSLFDQCEFRTTEFFFDPALWSDYGVNPNAGSYHVGLFGVKNVSFLRCRFANDHPQDYAPHLRGSGIFGIESGLYLRELSYCSFTGMSDAVWMQASGFSANAINITGCEFNNNIHSIVLEGTRFSAVFKNVIDVPESPQYDYPVEHLEKGYDKPVGVFMLGSVDYRVEENLFNVGDGESQITPTGNCDNCSYDIVVYNTAMLDSVPPIYGTGTVYKNDMHHASMGLQVQGYNGGGNSPDGLEVMCNEFYELVNYDFILNGRIADPLLPDVLSEIRNQGVCAPSNIDAQATNFFLSSCTSQADNQVNINTYSGPYDYSDDGGTYPLCFNVNQNDCVSGFPNSCSSRLSSRPYFTGIILNYATATTNHEAAKHELDSLIDGGDTDALADFIDNNTGVDLYDSLMICSPWLSDAVLLILLDDANRSKLSEAQLVNILLANAHLSSLVWQGVLDANPALGTPSMTALTAAQGTMGDRELKERELGAWLFASDLAANEITEYALRTDSLQEGIDALENTTRISEMQKLFMLHLAARAFANAESVLDAIVTAQGKETGWTILAAITLTQQQEERTWLMATNKEVTVIDSIWEENGERAMGPRAISAYYSKKQFSREPFGLHVDARYGQMEQQQPTENSTPVLMSVYPNPAANSASVIINGLPTTDGTTLEITNTLGQVIETITIKGTAPIELDLSQYAPGMLYLRLVSDGTCISTEKLLIVK